MNEATNLFRRTRALEAACYRASCHLRERNICSEQFARARHAIVRRIFEAINRKASNCDRGCRHRQPSIADFCSDAAPPSESERS